MESESAKQPWYAVRPWYKSVRLTIVMAMIIATWIVVSDAVLDQVF